MSADTSDLEVVGRLLQMRSDDLYHLGRVVTERTSSVDWQCAKADRFRSAMDHRRTEVTRLSNELRELGLAVRAKAAQATVDPTTP